MKTNNEVFNLHQGTAPDWKGGDGMIQTIDKQARRLQCDANLQDGKVWRGVFMWDELTDTVAGCCARCHLRHHCVAFTYAAHTCFMYQAVHDMEVQTGAVSGRITGTQDEVPPDCRTSVSPCDCPRTTWSVEPGMMLERTDACAVLSNKTVYVSGDSLMRDLWTTMAMWLLVLDGINPIMDSGAENHAACMSNAWKILDFIGITDKLKKGGLIREQDGQTTI